MTLMDGEQLVFSKAHFAARLKIVRQMCGASQKSLAEASGVSRSTISRYESGGHMPSTYQVICLAEALHASMDYLIVGENPPSLQDIAGMRLQWTLDRMTPGQTESVMTLIDGILSQMPRRGLVSFRAPSEPRPRNEVT